MKLQFLGSGDAFGSGGRFNTCMFVETGSTGFLIDCGASALIAMKRFGVIPNSIDTIFITHLHADHFGGLPFFILDAQFFAKRTTPLTIVGPPGIKQRIPAAMEIFFPGSSQTKQRFQLRIVELETRVPTVIDTIRVTPFVVDHDEVAPFFAYRFEVDDRIIAYSGDTEWRDDLIEVGKQADLFVCEAYFYEKPVRMHLNLKTLEAYLPHIRPKRLILTHMNDDILQRLPMPGYETAEDGKVITF